MKILFVCTGNSCRSVMARAYLEKRLAETGRTGVEVSSAGVAPVPGMKATEEAKQVVIEEGCNIDDHIARKVTRLAVQEADLILVMEKAHRDYIIGRYPAAAKKTCLLKDYKRTADPGPSQDPGIRDPIGRDINFYREVFAEIKESIERILKQI